MAASSSDRNPSKLVAAQLAALRPKTGMYNNKRIYASVVQADSPFQEEPRQGSPARILDECGQASELRGLPRKLIQFHLNTAQQRVASSVAVACARFDVPSNEWASS